MTCETLQKGPIKDLFSSCTWSNHTPRQANKCSTNANCFLEKNLFYRCARMDFVAKILIDQQDIAGRMSRGGECCEINLASMQLPLGISALVVELLFKRGMNRTIIRTWDETINCLKWNVNLYRMIFGVKSIKFQFSKMLHEGFLWNLWFELIPQVPQ